MRSEGASIFDTRAARVTLVMCALFSANGVILPYLSRWLEVERGLAGAEIGVVLSLAQLARIFTGPFIALRADSARDRRSPLRVLAVAALFAFAAFFTVARDFWSLVIFGFVALTLFNALMPFAEGALLRAAEGGRLPYGVARGVGSLSFIFANVAGGIVLARFGAGAVAVWVLASLAVTAASAWLGLKPEPPAAAEGGAMNWTAVRGLLANRRYLRAIVACGLIQGAHAFYYGFSVLAWRGQGIDAETVGLLWGVAVAAEVVFLMSLPRIEPRLSPESLIMIGAGGAVLRWALLGFAPVGWALWPIQTLHACTFAAAHVGAMRLIFRETPDASAGLAQTLYAALASGLVMGLSTLASGALYDAFGARGYWAMAALALMGALTAAPLLRTAPARRAG